MGLKRVQIMAEVTYPADDERDMEALSAATVTALTSGVNPEGGTVARAAILSSAVDPDPEPVAEDVPPPPPPNPWDQV